MKLLWLLALRSTSAYDDQSLMQQEYAVSTQVGQELQERSRALRFAQNELGAAVQRLPDLGHGRKMALDSMMQELSDIGYEELGNPTNAQLFAEIRELLLDIVQAFQNTRDSHDTQLLESISTILTCYTTGAAYDAQMEANWLNSKASHTSCRTVEETELNNATDHCGIMTTQMVTMRDQAQNGPHYLQCGGFFDQTIAPFDTTGTVHQNLADISAKLNDNFASWDSAFQTTMAWFDLGEAQLAPLIDPCVSSMQIYENEQQNCNNDQGTAENAYCIHKTTREWFCDCQVICYHNTTTTHFALVSRYRTLATRRMLEGEAILYIDCLVGLLQISVTDISQCAGIPNITYVDFMFNITEPPIPNETSCDVSMVQLVPSDPAFRLANYADLPALAPATSSTQDCT